MSTRRKTRAVSSGSTLTTPSGRSAPRKSALSVKSKVTRKSSKSQKVTIAPEALQNAVASMRSSSSSAAKAARTGAGRPSMPAVATQGAAAGVADPAVAFYGVKPLAVVDDLVNALHDYACDGLDALEGRLVETAQAEELSHVIAGGLDKSQQILQAAIDKNMDILEMFTLKVMELPPSMTVDMAREAAVTASGERDAARRRSSMGTTDGWTAMSHSAEELYELTDPARVKVLDEQLAAMRKKVLAKRFVNDAMKKELNAIQTDLAQSRPLRDAMSFMDESKAVVGIAGALSDITSETLKQASGAFRSVRDLGKVVADNGAVLHTALGIKSQYQKDSGAIAGSGSLDQTMLAALAPAVKIQEDENGRQSLGRANLDLTPGRK